jgi:hypothetical protein
MWNNDQMHTITAEYSDGVQPISMSKLQPDELRERALALQN